MTTTIDIESDVLAQAEKMAREQGTTTGKVISDLARRSLTAQPASEKWVWENGVPVLPSRGVVITSEDVQRIIDEENI